MSNFKEAVRDFIESIQKNRIWLYLGQMDVKQRYRRSIIGPWWISISTLIFIASMSIVFSRIFQQSAKEYVPFFTAGFLVWQLISSTINESVDLFRGHSGYIKQTRLPYNIYVFKYLTRQLIIFFHNIVVFGLIAWYFQIHITYSILLTIPALFLVIVNLYWMTIVTSFIGARFRDMAPIINNCIQVAFFITPVSWMPKLLGPQSLIIRLNPLAYFIDLIRKPLLGTTPEIHVWLFVSCFAIIGIVFSTWIFSACHKRLCFWID